MGDTVFYFLLSVTMAAAGLCTALPWILAAAHMLATPLPGLSP